jgi:hypothetical protein
MYTILLSSVALICCFSSWAVLTEPEDDQGLKKTVIRDLRRSGNDNEEPVYRPGEFPFEHNACADLYKTVFCPEVTAISLAQQSLKAQQIAIAASLSQQESVLIAGKDGRTRVQDTKQLPYRLYGRLYFTFPGGKKSVGTGTLVGPHHVLTAGHCLYSHKAHNTGWATGATFVPAQEGDVAPFGQVPGKVLLSIKNWTASKSEEHDFALVILDKPIGYQLGWAGLLSAPDAFLKNNHVSISGYPGDKEPDGHMWTMSNNIKTVMPNRLRYDIDTERGQSGSGVCMKLHDNGIYVVGVHAYAEGQPGAGNSGPRITSAVFKRLVSWMAEYQLKEFIHPSLPCAEEKAAQAAFLLYKLRAENDDTEAAYQVGKYYEAHREDGKAFAWYEKAAEKQHLNALLRLANLYRCGRGCQQDVTAALAIFQRLDDQGDVAVQISIGDFYSDAYQEKDRDYEKALYWYHKGAEKDSPEAQFKLSKCYIQCLRKRRYYVQAFNWCCKSAEQNYAVAQNYLGCLYYLGVGTAKNEAEAYACFAKGAEQENPAAQTNVGFFYREGKIVSQDYAKAKHWFDRGAAQNEALAQSYIGLLYFDGKGVPQSYKQAKDWFDKGAKQGCPEAFYNLGRLYHYGLGVAKDKKMALKWYEQAALQLHEKAVLAWCDLNEELNRRCVVQ